MNMASCSGVDVVKKIFLFSSGCHFVMRSKSICAMLVKSNIRTFLLSYNFEFVSVVHGSMWFKDVSVFISACHFVKRSNTICSIVLEGIIGNIHV